MDFFVFEDMVEKDIFIWNVVLVGCVYNGFGKEVIEMFRRMEFEWMLFDEIRR